MDDRARDVGRIIIHSGQPSPTEVLSTMDHDLTRIDGVTGVRSAVAKNGGVTISITIDGQFGKQERAEVDRRASLWVNNLIGQEVTISIEVHKQRLP